MIIVDAMQLPCPEWLSPLSAHGVLSCPVVVAIALVLAGVAVISVVVFVFVV
jgi:hypothetical protein